MKQLISIGKILAIAILILGIIHDVATFTPLIRDGLECLSKENMDAMIYMSLICGMSLILSGILLIMIFNKLKRFIWLSIHILIIACFICLNGILSVYYMSDNPFAWMNFSLGLAMLCIALMIRKRVHLS